MFSRERRRLWGDLIVAFHYKRGEIIKRERDFLIRACNDQKTANSFKMKAGKV